MRVKSYTHSHKSVYMYTHLHNLCIYLLSLYNKHSGGQGKLLKFLTLPFSSYEARKVI